MQTVREGGDWHEVLHGEHVPAGSASGWPLVIELPPLGALRTSPGAARAHVRVAVAAWRLEDDMADAAVVVTSELVTNAVQASAGRTAGRCILTGTWPLSGSGCSQTARSW